MSDSESFLEYALSDETRVLLQFGNINDRDGCHISLDMFKAQLGPITEDVLAVMLQKFNGQRIK